MSDVSLDAEADLERRRQLYESVRPASSLLHALSAATAFDVSDARLEITTIDGTVYPEVSPDFFYLDGLSTVLNGERVYFPMTSLLRVKIFKKTS